MYLFTIEYGFAQKKTIWADGYEMSTLLNLVSLYQKKDGAKMLIATFRDVRAIWGEEEQEKAEVAPVQQEKNFWDENDPSGGSLPGPASEMDEDEKLVQDVKEARQQDHNHPRKKVDAGKVWALKKAGWTARQISAEMKISEATVWNVCKKMKEREEAKKSEGVEGMRDLPQDL